MKARQSTASDDPLDLGPDGERHFQRLRASIEYGQGFELYFCGFESSSALLEVRRRLETMPPEGHIFEALPLEGPAALRTIAESLAAVKQAPNGRKIVFITAAGWEQDVKAEWAVAMRRLNERRNIVIRDCPNSIIMAGPSWLPWLVHDQAPDLWSVRTAVFIFPIPPSRPDILAAPAHDMWPSHLPMEHELQPPDYYEELAAALETSRNPGEQETRGRLLLRASSAWELSGQYDRAIEAARMARFVFAGAHEELMVAVSMGYVADILQQRGDTEEALRIRKEEQLPVYERLGNVRSRAITMGKIADILQQRGDAEEALRIRREEQIPVFERIGDVRSRAITMGRIADILQQRGDTDQALRIRREEELPVYEQLGDVRSRAITMGQIADVLQQRGDTQEALRILREEQLPVFERIGDVRSRAVTLGQIADILQQRGDNDQALALLEQAAAVFEKLKLPRESAWVSKLLEKIRQGEKKQAKPTEL